MIALALLLQVAAAAPTRPYWTVSIDSLAVGRTTHTHVSVEGTVDLVRLEPDGDLHIRLRAKSGAFIVAECIPRLPCRRPRVGEILVVRGISRRDPEHGWYELHPVEGMSPP